MQGLAVAALDAVVEVGKIATEIEIFGMRRIHNRVMDWSQQALGRPGGATLLHQLQHAHEVFDQRRREVGRIAVDRPG